MGRVFKFAIHRKLIPKTCNPVEAVEWSGESDYTAAVISPEQSKAIYDELKQPENTLLLLLACTGLRCSEALGLKWEEVDPQRQAIFIRRSWSMDKEGRPKSKASKAPVPCIPALAAHLDTWRKESPYSLDSDWVFPSFKNRGRTPRSVQSRCRLHQGCCRSGRGH